MSGLFCLGVALLPVGGFADKIKGDYRSLLAQGRKLVSEYEYAQAVSAFEAALSTRPDDAVALNELSFAALMKGDLKLARSAADTALAKATVPNLRAAALYNQGRSCEAEKDTKGAIDAYRRSLKLRQSDVVTSRLAGLDPSTPAANPLKPQQLAGPFASEAAYCKREMEEYVRRMKTPEFHCPVDFEEMEGIKLQSSLAAPPAPLKSIKVVSSRGQDVSVNVCHILMQTPAGWYGAHIESYYNGCVPTGFTVLPRSGGLPPIIQVRLVMSVLMGSEDNPAARQHPFYEDRAVLCAIGPSGRPACTESLIVARAHQPRPSQDESPKPLDWFDRRRLSLDASGAVRVEVAGWQFGNELTESRFLGTHRIAFP